MRVIVCMVVIVFLSSTLIADSIVTMNVKKGENNIMVENYFHSLPVSSLISTNPQVQSVTLLEEGQTLGYVNVFGGIGTDFLIEPGKTYEVHSSEDLVIFLNN